VSDLLLIAMQNMTYGLMLRSDAVQLDILIVITSLVLLVTENAKIKAIKALRALRTVKPLRMLTHSAGMRVVLKAVALSVAAIANVSLLLVLTFIVFGAMGIQLFSGRLYRYASFSPRAQQSAICGQSSLEYHCQTVHLDNICTYARMHASFEHPDARTEECMPQRYDSMVTTLHVDMIWNLTVAQVYR
jgi:hypothetical protein